MTTEKKQMKQMLVTINERNRIATVVGFGFTKVERLNVCEKKSIQEKIQVLMTYSVLEKPETKEAKILQIGKVRFLKELAKEVGPAIGKYAQYEYGFDLEYAQNTDESIDRICNKWERGVK